MLSGPFSLIEGFQIYSLSRHIGKREADAEALHGTVATTLYNTRISKPIKKVRDIVILIVAVIVIILKMLQSPSSSNFHHYNSISQVGHPDCVSTPVRQCENIPNANKRNVARTVCDTVVDSHEVEVTLLEQHNEQSKFINSLCSQSCLFRTALRPSLRCVSRPTPTATPR